MRRRRRQRIPRSRAAGAVRGSSRGLLLGRGRRVRGRRRQRVRRLGRLVRPSGHGRERGADFPGRNRRRRFESALGRLRLPLPLTGGRTEDDRTRLRLNVNRRATGALRDTVVPVFVVAQAPPRGRSPRHLGLPPATATPPQRAAEHTGARRPPRRRSDPRSTGADACGGAGRRGSLRRRSGPSARPPFH